MNGIESIMDAANEEAALLWEKIEHLRNQRAAIRQKSGKSQNKQGEEIERWRRRALVAEARLADHEKLMKTERILKQNALSEKARLEEELDNERATSNARFQEVQHELEDLEVRSSIERKHLLSLTDNLKSKLKAINMNLERERELRLDVETALAEVQNEIRALSQERNEIESENRVLLTKLELLEKEVMPREKEERKKLEVQVQSLRMDLEETIEAETAFRTLFLKEQSARRMRRSQHRDDLESA